ncbi:unnamed protein product [Haemonchus placei]|uniref:Uncharacterized protein n=1 Tax=Haemonchus placei TaxID=6290 RepID=A0A0N4VUU2_HAEPC|nr:unnamed protein product [Haemonchus placei]
MSNFRRGNRSKDISILPQTVDRQVDVAVEEIRVEVEDCVLQYPSMCSNWSVEVDEAPAGFADARPGLGGFSITASVLSFRCSFMDLCIASQIRTFADDCL